MREDVIACEGETFPDGEPLLRRVMQRGERTGPAPDLKEIQEHARQEIAKLPPGCMRLQRPVRYPVSFSEHLESLYRLVRKQMKKDVRNRAARITA